MTSEGNSDQHEFVQVKARFSSLFLPNKSLNEGALKPFWRQHLIKRIKEALTNTSSQCSIPLQIKLVYALFQYLFIFFFISQSFTKENLKSVRKGHLYNTIHFLINKKISMFEKSPKIPPRRS